MVFDYMPYDLRQQCGCHVSHEVLSLEDEQNTFALQETITYPTLGSWESIINSNMPSDAK